MKTIKEKTSVRILKECIELQEKKGRDYQNPNSSVKQADYYPSGVLTIYEVMHAKMLRIKSLMESYKDGHEPDNEPMTDSFKDLINYTSFGASWLEGGIDGQDPDVDIFNKKRSK